MVEHVLDNLAPISGIDRVYVVTNAKFAGHFQKWSEQYRATKSKFEFTVVNDGTTDDTNKLGAIGDINHVLKTQNVDDDLIVVAGDNLFSEKLGDFGEFCRAKNAPVLALYDVGDLEQIKNTIPSPRTPPVASLSSRKSRRTRRAHSPASRFTFIRRAPSRSSRNTSPRATIRPARPAGAMALPAHRGPYLACAWYLVRHRLEGNAGGSQPDFREVREKIKFRL